MSTQTTRIALTRLTRAHPSEHSGLQGALHLESSAVHAPAKWQMDWINVMVAFSVKGNYELLEPCISITHVLGSVGVFPPRPSDGPLTRPSRVQWSLRSERVHNDRSSLSGNKPNPQKT